MTETDYDEVEATNHEELKVVILDWLKDNEASATTPYQEFYEAINKIAPTPRATLAVTVTLMELNGEVKIIKDEQGRGLGFLLP
jgi:hypothetical protein